MVSQEYILVLNNQVWLFWYQAVKGKATREMTHVFASKAHEKSQDRCHLELNESNYKISNKNK